MKAPHGALELPHFSAPSAREQAALEASRTVLELLLRTRSADFSVKELAARTQLSERTFYRYFPRKEDAIRPYLEAGLGHVLERARRAPHSLPLRDVLADAHADLLDLALTEEAAGFLAILQEHEALRGVWLQVMADAEEAFARFVAERLGIAPDAVQARLAGASLVTAGRLALRSVTSPEDSPPPSQVFRACLDLLGPTLLEPPPSDERS